MSIQIARSFRLAMLILCYCIPATAAEQMFDARVDCWAGDGACWVATGDLDGNGTPDLAVANFNSDDVSVLLGLGRHLPGRR